MVGVPMEPTSFGNSAAKLLAILILGVGSFIAGIVPLHYNQRQKTNPKLISALLCFGAGVLLATALVHMLPEVQLVLPKSAGIVFCLGYLLIYAIEEWVQMCAESNPISCCYGHSKILLSESHSRNDVGQLELEQSSTMARKVNPGTGTFSLLLALFIHSLLEGLAIGVQSTAPKVLLLLGAVSAHKFVVAFCLGVEICSHGSGGRKWNVGQILIFALGSVAGIGIGMALDGLDDTFNGLVMPALQGIAGGTLLYVTVSEVLPRERAKRHPGAGNVMYQLIAVLGGFTVMSVLSVLISES